MRRASRDERFFQVSVPRHRSRSVREERRLFAAIQGKLRAKNVKPGAPDDSKMTAQMK
jgi:hypothetical protein